MCVNKRYELTKYSYNANGIHSFGDDVALNGSEKSNETKTTFQREVKLFFIIMFVRSSALHPPKRRNRNMREH